MRVLVVALLMLLATACERSSKAPRPPGAAAMAPAASASVSQAAAVELSAPAMAPSAASAKPATAAPRKAAAARIASAPGKRSQDDTRWVDVDENDPAFAQFQAEQEQRDRELLERDAEQAVAGPADRRDEAYDPEPTGRNPPEEDLPPYDSSPYDPAPPDDLPPLEDDNYDQDAGGYADPDYPPPDDDYDPRYDR